MYFLRKQRYVPSTRGLLGGGACQSDSKDVVDRDMAESSRKASKRSSRMRSRSRRGHHPDSVGLTDMDSSNNEYAVTGERGSTSAVVLTRKHPLGTGSESGSPVGTTWHDVHLDGDPNMNNYTQARFRERGYNDGFVPGDPLDSDDYMDADYVPGLAGVDHLARFGDDDSYNEFEDQDYPDSYLNALTAQSGSGRCEHELVSEANVKDMVDEASGVAQGTAAYMVHLFSLPLVWGIMWWVWIVNRLYSTGHHMVSHVAKSDVAVSAAKTANTVANSVADNVGNLVGNGQFNQLGDMMNKAAQSLNIMPAEKTDYTNKRTSQHSLTPSASFSRSGNASYSRQSLDRTLGYPSNTSFSRANNTSFSKSSFYEMDQPMDQPIEDYADPAPMSAAQFEQYDEALEGKDGDENQYSFNRKATTAQPKKRGKKRQSGVAVM